MGRWVILPTDFLLYVLVAAFIGFYIWARGREHLRAPWRIVMNSHLAVIALTVLTFYIVVGLVDSIHYQKQLPALENGQTSPHYSGEIYSLLDWMIAPIGENDEKTYSAPMATHLFSKENTIINGVSERIYPRLQFAGHSAQASTRSSLWRDVFSKTILGLSLGLIGWLIFSSIIILLRYFKHQRNPQLPRLKTFNTFLLTLLALFLFIGVTVTVGKEFHILGTDKVGQDVFYQTLKSIRTGLVIGTLTTLIMLPFAIIFGTMAGYFGGITDDAIQYIYTTLSSIPGVLLIAASILSLEILVANHPDWFYDIAERADIRLLALCIILGVTSWTGLCRLLRAEALKLRELDYVQSAHALGVSAMRIISRHIVPNLMHIVLITVVLDFSGLVLAEAVLTYVGVGVDPNTLSWGNMINSARLELAREPLVWWPLFAAFLFMFSLVLAANIFADKVRDAFDPRAV